MSAMDGATELLGGDVAAPTSDKAMRLKGHHLPLASSSTLQMMPTVLHAPAHAVVESISVEELRYLQEERTINAPVIRIPFIELPHHETTALVHPSSRTLTQAGPASNIRDPAASSTFTSASTANTSSPKNALVSPFNNTSWSANETALQVSVHFNFLPSPALPLSPITFMMPNHDFCGSDIVRSFLYRLIATDASLEQQYSTDPHCYKLYIADELTGEPEMAVQLDHSAPNFVCYFVEPLLAAQLKLFPQRSALLPAPSDNIMLRVQVRSRDTPNRAVSRMCVIPCDLVVERLESVVAGLLPACEITQGSLRVVYGPLELSVHERYNFGMGCGNLYCPISQLTVLALHRFGVSEVVVTGCTTDDASTGLGNSVMRTGEDIVIEMKLEEAMSFQQFEVISTNRYGAQQQRLLCVDGEHLYTVRPNITDTLPQTTERMIADIEDVRCFANKPLYMEIEYAPSSGFEIDRFECTTAYNRALLDEKLHIIRRELRKRAEKSATQAQETVFSRFFQGVYNKLRFIR